MEKGSIVKITGDTKYLYSSNVILSGSGVKSKIFFEPRAAFDFAYKSSVCIDS